MIKHATLIVLLALVAVCNPLAGTEEAATPAVAGPKYPIIVDMGDYYRVMQYWFRGDMNTTEPVARRLTLVKKGSVVGFETDWQTDAPPGIDPEIHMDDRIFRDPKMPRNSRYLILFMLDGGHIVTGGAVNLPQHPFGIPERGILGFTPDDLSQFLAKEWGKK